MNLNILDIVKAVGGRLLNPPGGKDSVVHVTSVSTDTRNISDGALFVPIVGENFDGHEYIQTAQDNGAVCALTERANILKNMGDDTGAIPLILVQSTRRALMDLAGYYRRLFDIKVVAVTGSAGKTTTKDMIYHILSQKFRTKKTQGNFNNEIGLPLSIFQLEADDECLVLEMGMNHAGEIHALSLVGAPDIAVITHIGDAHIENFANREGILHAKLEIVDGLHPNGTVILNGDDPLLTGEIARHKTGAFEVLYPSANHIVESLQIGLEESRCLFHWLGQDIRVTVPIPGAHMVMNALLAVAVGVKMGVAPDDMAQGFAALTPASGRLTVESANDMVIINDVYNANPQAMQEAIRVICAHQCHESTQQKCRKVAILGDMSELGQMAAVRHREVGAFALMAGIDLLVAIGPLSKEIFSGFTKGTNVETALYFETVEPFLLDWPHILRPGDIVLVKASRSMAFEKITDALLASPLR